MTKRYKIRGGDELTQLQNWRKYCEQRAMQVLVGSLHLVKKGEKILPPEIQNKKDLLLYKYYEHQFELTDELITNLCK